MTIRPEPSPRVRAAAALLPAVAPVLLLAPSLVRGSLVYGYDTLGELFPWWTWAWREIARGEFPHWNPNVMCGLPFHGLAVVSLLYPLSLLNLILDTPRVITLWWLIHLALAGCFTQRFTRALGASPSAAALAGLTFGSSEALVSRIAAGELPQLAVVAWVPALLWLIEDAIAQRRAARLLLGAVPIALMLLAGHLQYVAYGSLVAGVYGAARLLGEPGLRRHIPFWLGLVGAWVLGLCLSAQQVLPTIDALRSSHRLLGLAPSSVDGIMLTPTGLTRLVLPDLFGNEYSSGYVGDSVATQIPLYIGIVPLILALAALFLAPRHTRLLGALALVAIVYALGNRTPVAPVLEALLPPLAAFRIPSRMLVIGALPLSVLAGLGFDALSRATASRCSTRLACVAVAGVVALATTGLLGLAAGVPFVKELWLVAIEGPQSHAPSEQVDAAWRVARAAAIPTTIVLLAGVGTLVALFRSGPTRRWPAVAVLALTFCDVTLHARPWVRELSPSVASMDDLVLGIVSAVRQDAETGLGARVLSQVPNRVQPVPISFLDSYGIGDTLGEVVPNWLAARGLRSVTGEIGLIPARTMLFTGNVGRYQIAAVEPQARLGMLGVSWIVGRHEPGSEVDERTSDRSPSALTLMRSPGALPIAVLARRVRVMAGVDQVREALDRTPGGGDPRDEVLVESPVAGHEADERDSADSPGVAKVTRIDTNRMVVEVDATRRAWLVMLDPYDPRWGATIDGHPAPVRPAHLMFRAVEVPSGHHLVAMRYVPVPFRIGVAIAALVAVPVVLMTLLVTRRTR